MGKEDVIPRGKLLVILILFILLFLLLFFRFGYWQIIKAEDLSQKAYSQQTKNSIISPKRGSIYDRNGVVLAKSVSVETISVTPKNIKDKDKEKVAKGLSEILSLDYDTVLGKVNKTTVEEVIAKKVDKSITDKVRSWTKEEKVSGINIYEDTKRYYPKGSFLSQVLGFCGTDNQGLEGLEAKYESMLRGVQGKRVTSKDATGKDMPLDDTSYVPPEDGLNLVLTIDERIQYIAEKYLRQALEDNKPTDYGTCVIMNPKNGDILAMATMPEFDPNDPFTPAKDSDKLNWDSYTSAQKSAALQDMWKNKNVTDAYEPGSIFKVVTASIAIEEGIVSNVDAINYNCTGSLKVGDWDISCWRTVPHGKQSLRQGLMNSCNPVYMSVALKIGPTRFYNYINAFGVSKSTNSGIIGEASGINHTEKKLKEDKSSLATSAFGQSFTLTPLNMLNTICCIANDGKLMRPRLVKEIQDGDGKIVERFDPVVVKQVISESTSDTVLDMMESVVSNGTGRYGQVKGYYIAGKTSTAEQGDKSHPIYVASFIALAPAKDPEVAVLFNLYNPKGVNGHQGGGIAAPVVSKIMGEILEYLDEPKDYEVEKEEVKAIVPNVTNNTLGNAKKMLTNSGIKYLVDDESNDQAIVKVQYPMAGEALGEKPIVRLYLEGNETRKIVEVPNVKKLGISNARSAIQEYNLNMKSTGTGIAIYQDPPAGSMVEEGTVINVQFGAAGIDAQ
ncbi:MAG: PASTA domain-containing protein [Clostridia bacterium]|nr:PASTA domain-containing protein [Clostridia bacterium]